MIQKTQFSWISRIREKKTEKMYNKNTEKWKSVRKQVKKGALFFDYLKKREKSHSFKNSDPPMRHSFLIK